MNIKRMADQYRAQLMATGIRAKDEVAEVVSDPCQASSIFSARRYLRGWYVKLSKALGNERKEELGNLRRAWECLAALGELRGKFVPGTDGRIHISNRVLARSLAKKAQKDLQHFLRELPEVTEKCLSYAVRTSGIRH